ncbi:HTH-type transcriptional regulator CynR [Baekduia alba]|uniref:LysR family transcriptional regulator n=1 Tax=Baekduia alba TaxID=2997333 RepID=UPI00234229B1|nr:LysR family transcriptional regulator [Baekduia alba]WCB91835.1 HTH-type transcriptional regulator CynR [Baekduia alba]
MSAAAPSWIGVEQRHLAAYAAVARHRSFRVAAEALGYSQPAISQLVRRLEKLVGTALVVRKSGSCQVGLTPAGTLMLRHAERLLDGFAAARADLAVLTGRDLRVGVLADLGGRVLAPMLLAARDAQVQVVELAGDAELSRAVARGELDVALGGVPPDADRLWVRRIGSDPYVLAVPAASPLAHLDGQRPPSELLERQPLIACGDPGELRRIDRELRARGVAPAWASRASSVPAALGAVRAGAGTAIVPASAIGPWDDALVPVALDGLVSPRSICRYVHRDRHLPDALAEVVAAGVGALDGAVLAQGS